MSKMMLAASAAALAVATPALAQNHGNGHGAGHGSQAKDHGGGQAMKMKGAGKAHVNGGQKAEVHGNPGRNGGPGVAIRGDGHGNAKVKVAGHPGKRADDVRTVRVADVRDDDRIFPRLQGRGTGLADGCPPGLAMKGNGCMPPGQFKKVGDPMTAALRSRALVGPYSQWYRDNDRYYYRMGDGVLYQVNRSNNLIDALIPYGMRDYSYYPVGYNYPSLYNSYNVPYAYRTYYPDGGDYLYRYGGNAIYAVNPQTNLVSSIVSLLAGDLSVGQPLPAGYGVYNVPLAYRDQYYDTADNWYRYNDGYIYRVDPTTQLVTAVINALV